MVVSSNILTSTPEINTERELEYATT
jgi:hypothetical protein